MRSFHTRLGTLAAFMLLALPVHAASAQRTTYAYAEINGRELLLDFYAPLTGEGPAPLIIWIHGGGWLGGSRATTGPTLGFRSEGYAVASIDYRLTSQAGTWGDASVVWPSQAHDVKAAVRWLRANAETLDIDPCAFISWGSSAGGHLSAILGTTNGDAYLEGDVGQHAGVSSDVQLAVDYFGPSDLLFMNPDVTTPPGSAIDHDALSSPESQLLGGAAHGHSVGDIRAHIDDPAAPWPGLVELAHSAAPARQALDAASNVPIYIAHGEMDNIVAQGQSQRLFDALTAAGTPVEYVSVPGAGHNLPGSVAELVAEWLDEQAPLIPPCGCPVDLAPPAGVLDLADISAFVAAFIDEQALADITGDGIFDLSDITGFVTIFTAGCS